MSDIETIVRKHLSDAERELSELYEEFERLEQKRTKLEWQIDYDKHLLGESTKKEHESLVLANEDAPPVVKDLKNATGWEAVLAVLRTSNGPIKIDDMVEQAMNRGYGDGDSKKIANYFSAVLHKALNDNEPVIARVSRGTYDLLQRLR
jgi:hypothetical protein